MSATAWLTIGQATIGQVTIDQARDDDDRVRLYPDRPIRARIARFTGTAWTMLEAVVAIRPS